jgi:hypothetical protein
MQDFWGKVNGFDLFASSRQELDEIGFTIIPGPVPADDLSQLVASYDAAVSDAVSDDVKVEFDDSNQRFCQSQPRVRQPVPESASSQGLLSHHRQTVQAEHDARSDIATKVTGSGTPCRLRARQSRLDDGRFHLHDRRVSKLQRCDSICAGFTPVVLPGVHGSARSKKCLTKKFVDRVRREKIPN